MSIDLGMLRSNLCAVYDPGKQVRPSMQAFKWNFSPIADHTSKIFRAIHETSRWPFIIDTDTFVHSVFLSSLVCAAS
jgi:hypothetical protein